MASKKKKKKKEKNLKKVYYNVTISHYSRLISGLGVMKLFLKT